MFRSMVTAAAAASLALAPTVAVAQVAPVRVAAQVEGSELNGETPFLGIAVIVAIIIAAFLLSDGDRSTSP